MAYPQDGIDTNPIPQLGDRNTKYASKYGTSRVFDVESQLLRGTMSFSPDRLRELDPSYQGYTHCFVLRTPPVLMLPAQNENNQVAGFEKGDLFNDTNNTGVMQEEIRQNRMGTASGDKAKHVARNLKTLFEMGCTSYSGTPSLTLNMSQVNTGWNDRQYYAPTYSEYNSTSFTMNVLETRGDPLRKGIEYYISAISDPAVKASLVNGALKDSYLISATLPNFTWTFMFVQTDQTLLNIQDISIWTSVMIAEIDRSNLDWDNGTVEIVQPRSIQCNGIYIPDSENPAMYKIARALLKRRLRYYRRFSDMSAEWMGVQTWDSEVLSTAGVADAANINSSDLDNRENLTSV